MYCSLVKNETAQASLTGVFRTTSLYRETNKQANECEPQASNIKIPKISEENLLRALPKSSLAYDRFLRYW